MKDFIKWLGVNEKVAKVAVWMLIIMVFLIIVNTALNSLGFPYYAITYDNLKHIDLGLVYNLFTKCIVCVLNFYAILLLVFRIKEAKKLFKWSILYLILNWVIADFFGYLATQIFIFLFFIIFPYMYTGKSWKYAIYGFMALIVNTLIEGITYYFKGSFIDITEISRVTRAILFSDYFIIMAIIILVKEIYLKKRGELKCGMEDQKAGCGLENSTKKANSLKKSQKKQAA